MSSKYEMSYSNQIDHSPKLTPLYDMNKGMNAKISDADGEYTPRAPTTCNLWPYAHSLNYHSLYPLHNTIGSIQLHLDTPKQDLGHTRRHGIPNLLLDRTAVKCVERRETLERCVFPQSEVALPRGMVVLATISGHGSWQNGISVPGCEVFVGSV